MLLLWYKKSTLFGGQIPLFSFFGTVDCPTGGDPGHCARARVFCDALTDALPSLGDP